MTPLDFFHKQAFSTLREELLHLAEINAAAGTIVHAGVPPLEQMEMDNWAVQLMPPGLFEAVVEEDPGKRFATAITQIEGHELPPPYIEAVTHYVRPIVWCQVTYLEFGQWWYGIGIHPTQLMLILFHSPSQENT